MLDEILPVVKKPIRYTGGEYNITIKTDAAVHVGIIFPEIYEIGMSNLGIKIIYHLFNQVKGIQCERIFAPWPDFGDALMSTKTPLYGLETKRPVSDFDLLGFSLQNELCYTTVLYMLELAHIPSLSASRDKNYPILLAGGPATLNPTPLSPVFDGFVIGDGEDAIPRIAHILKTFPREKKDERLQEIATLPGVWVPSIHGRDTSINKHVVSQLTDDTIPSPAILPICDITHDRLAIEVMRGCSWGCRFCQAGYTNRPLRMRSHTDIVKAVERGVRQTGWEEISLLSFSILDYPDILNLIRKLNEILHKKMVSISLPAMRGELFNENLAILLKEIKKTGLTFAPEAGSERLRCRLNKSVSNETLVHSINTAYQYGWKQVKLYFMIGLPFEEESDVDEINILIQNILQAYPKGSIKLSVNPFIPKPHTPFESAEFAPIDELNDKIERIKRGKKRRAEMKYQAPEVAFIEAFLSKADEKIFPVIESVYRQGGRFEEWREGFDFSRWRSAFDRTGIDPHHYLKPRDRYPWDFINIGVKKEFLREEYKRAEKKQVTENCYYAHCTECGACDGAAPKHFVDPESYVSYGTHPKKNVHPRRYRVKYTITEPFRYASHLDITRTIYRALRRSDLPIQLTEGFSPIPKVSFCPPKSVGQIAKGDFFDFYLVEEYFGNISQELNARFPSGIRILEVRSLPIGVPSLMSSINLVCYEVSISADHVKKLLPLSTHTPAYIQTKSGIKNIAESVESISMNGNVLHCGLHFGKGKINIYSLVSYLTDMPVELTRKYKTTRTALFIKDKGIVYSPMEVM